MIPENRRTTAPGADHVDRGVDAASNFGQRASGSRAVIGTPAESVYEHRLSGTARDARLIDVFLHASTALSASSAAEEIGVRVTTVHRWRSTGGERLSPDVRRDMLAYLARWSQRSEFPIGYM